MSETENKPEAESADPGQILALLDQIAELKKRWPAHSTPPAMMQRLDELEEELESLKSAAPGKIQGSAL